MEPYDCIVELAFQKMKQRNQLNDDEANETLQQLYKHIEDWDGATGRLSFVGDYLVGIHMNKIIARGSATGSTEEFIRLMTMEPSVQKKIVELMLLRKTGPLDERLTNRIKDVEIEHAINSHPSLLGNAPNQYINRFICCMFMEIMTPVANNNDLKKIAKILDIRDINVSFINLQVRVRGQVESALQRLKLDQEVSKLDVFRRALIAYHIPQTYKELNG
ncbi:hypothetical protein [Paenibacillus borealis]|uniref:Uncharacterized protein n=1 Tax=Paenibacillus borealis TaxID=160799 RepID=A0A089LCU3_PAEBO|nr:hypothetical protein [Paenibacillus borealis]AIQ56943.1 hypothetical protein PBOR_08330 [Paenibacillus borealis]